MNYVRMATRGEDEPRLEIRRLRRELAQVYSAANAYREIVDRTNASCCAGIQRGASSS